MCFSQIMSIMDYLSMFNTQTKKGNSEKGAVECLTPMISLKVQTNDGWR
jgi:hypothetical protein